MFRDFRKAMYNIKACKEEKNETTRKGKKEKGREGERKNHETHTTWGRNSSHHPIGCSV